MRIRATVAGLTSNAAPMAASVQPGPASPWLAFNKIRAWVNALAGATPRPIMVCSRARSSSDRTTTCRLRTWASCSGGIPGPHEHETEPPISQLRADELLAWPRRCDRARRRDEMSFRKRRAAPSADQEAGELLSWVVGRKHARPARSRTDIALGELLSWVGGRKRRR